MTQPLLQVPPLQNCAAPQLVPSDRVVKAVVEVVGVQTWQALLGFAAPEP
jgi:hypothetical protein